ncbi:hypothetical protein A4A49_26239 [Nicotiana attenuata]|uniref:Uncharacterized protein n=3 Tax=Nicotiana attenuata TaxID=49451 RepID=A0A1J6KWR9_NICAT|nr:hypothetical protein A4A49_26239 [Nicotiana attenuata]
MASNRKVQRLLNEFMDLISEYDDTSVEQNNVATITSTEMNFEQSNVATTTSVLATDKMDTDVPTTQRTVPQTPITNPTPSTSLNDRENPTRLAVQSSDHVEPCMLLKETMDSDQQETDEAKSVPPPTDQMSLDPPASVESEPSPSPKEKVS